MNIYVVGSSKNKFLPLDGIREPFFVDKKHDGDNIDFLNPWYCELTGMYYLWKHCTDDIVGLEHYRRYFVNGKGKLLSESEIREILKENDVICRKYVFAPKANPKNAFSVWSAKNLPYFKKFLTFCSKPEQSFLNKELSELPYFAQCNMFIGRSKILSDYMDWFLDYAIEFKKTDLFAAPRIVGYISEFLFGAWLKMNGYKIYWNPSVTFNQSLTKIIERL